MKLTVLSLSLVIVLCIASSVPKGRKINRCTQRCPFCPPQFVPCKYGFEQDFCGCCITCMKGPGQSCGERLEIGLGGKCGDGLYCLSTSTFPQFQDKKICRPNTTRCRSPCPPIFGCPPLLRKCTHGYGLDICGCCEVCLQGPDEPCGEFLKCGVGLDCFEIPGSFVGICIRRLPQFF